MNKVLMILLALLTVVCLAASPILLTHSNMLPEKATAYYELKAYNESMSAEGPEAELMRMLLGTAPAPAVEPFSPAFSWYGMILAIGSAAALVFLFLCARIRRDLQPALTWTGLLAVPFGLIGARLVYCLCSLPFYVKDIAAPEAMLKVWEGGLSLSGALIFVGLAGLLGAKLGKASAGEVLHAMTPSLCFLIGAAAIASRTVTMGYGPEMAEGILTISINGTPRLDTAWLVIVLVYAVLLAGSLLMKKTSLTAASRFALYVFLYGTVMILLESLRKDGHMVWGFVHAEMVFDLCFALPALLYLARTRARILLSLLFTALLAGAVVALEFALDRAAIGDGLLYAVYVAVLAAYLFWGYVCAKRAKAA